MCCARCEWLKPIETWIKGYIIVLTERCIMKNWQCSQRQLQFFSPLFLQDSKKSLPNYGKPEIKIKRRRSKMICGSCCSALDLSPSWLLCQISSVRKTCFPFYDLWATVPFLRLFFVLSSSVVHPKVNAFAVNELNVLKALSIIDPTFWNRNLEAASSPLIKRNCFANLMRRKLT